MPEEWQICLDSWLLLAQSHLLMSTKEFCLKVTKDRSLVQFLVSYAKNSEATDAKESELRRNCFLLFHRVLNEVKPVPDLLLDWACLADLSRIYAKTKVLSQLLINVWKQAALDERLSTRNHKARLIIDLEHNPPRGDLEEVLASVVALLRACYPYGQFLMLGSDLIDGLAAAYKNVKAKDMKHKMAIVTYFSLVTLMEPDRPRISTLLDHLYSLKASAVPDSLLAELIGSTPLLRKMQELISGPEATRAKSLIESLKAFEKSPDGRRKIDKGKRKDREQYGHDPSSGIHVHKLSLVAQIQDLFPDLGSAFIVKLLDEYNDDTEQVTLHLLDDSLPQHLKAQDRAENLPEGSRPQSHDLVPNLAPHPTPPLLPTRRNIHDDDDFDRLAIDPSKISLGRKNPDLTADQLLSTPPPSSQKAAILSALAAFDPDDDERDDTYDIADVGGTVDTTNDDDAAAERREEVHEEALFNAYKMSPEVFGRDSETRRGKYRAALKSETGMTDEAIEGWGIMNSRDPRRLRRLERRHEMGGGAASQTQLGRSSWTADSGAEGTEDSDVGGSARGGRDGGGRARGRGRGGGGASVAGPSDDKGTQAARQRKDANKGSRANHNRRDQRARKMARGGLMG